jgi:hypothetical protein
MAVLRHLVAPLPSAMPPRVTRARAAALAPVDTNVAAPAAPAARPKRGAAKRAAEAEAAEEDNGTGAAAAHIRAGGARRRGRTHAPRGATSARPRAGAAHCGAPLARAASRPARTHSSVGVC